MATDLSALGLAVKRLQMRHHRALDAALAPVGTSLAQWDVLRHLHAHSDASLHDLARLTFQTDQAMGKLAQRMIDRGLIERRDTAGRAVRHRLTAHGERIRRDGYQRVEEVLGSSFAPLDPQELELMATLLAKLVPTPGG